MHHTAANAEPFGIHVGNVSVDFASVMDGVHDVIDQIARYEDSSQRAFASTSARRRCVSSASTAESS